MEKIWKYIDAFWQLSEILEHKRDHIGMQPITTVLWNHCLGLRSEKHSLSFGCYKSILKVELCELMQKVSFNALLH